MGSYFIFGGLNTADYGIVVNARDRYSVPVRDYTEHKIIGRNGVLYTDNERYENVPITYHCYLPTASVLGFGQAFAEFRNRLAMMVGYQDLVDSYEPDKTRRGILTATVTPVNAGPAWTIGEFDITFSCQPQIYTVKGQQMQLIGSVIMGAIAYAESSITPSSTGSVLRNSSAYCRTGAISVRGGSSITLQTTHTAHDAVQVYVAEFSDNGVTESSLVKHTWVAVPKNERAYFMLQDSTKFIRLCWNANTMTTTDETNQQIVTIECSAGIFRFGTNRIYYDFASAFSTSPVICFWSYNNHSAEKITMNGVTVRIGSVSGVDKFRCDCEQEIFTDASGNSVNSVCGVFGNESCTKPSAVFPKLNPGLNVIKTYNSTWDNYDPPHVFYLITREWEL